MRLRLDERKPEPLPAWDQTAPQLEPEPSAPPQSAEEVSTLQQGTQLKNGSGIQIVSDEITVIFAIVRLAFVPRKKLLSLTVLRVGKLSESISGLNTHGRSRPRARVHSATPASLRWRLGRLSSAPCASRRTRSSACRTRSDALFSWIFLKHSEFSSETCFLNCHSKQCIYVVHLTLHIVYIRAWFTLRALRLGLRLPT